MYMYVYISFVAEGESPAQLSSSTCRVPSSDNRKEHFGITTKTSLLIPLRLGRSVTVVLVTLQSVLLDRGASMLAVDKMG